MRGWKRSPWPLVAAVAVGCTAAGDADGPAESADEAPAETAEEGVVADPSGEPLTGWNVRLDETDEEPAAFRMVTTEGGFTVETGPAGIAWRSEDLVQEGDFTASATFTELGAPAGHREAFGLFVGGRHLESPDQEYTYFLVRGDGRYLIKRRTGDATSDLVSWTASEAVQGIQAEGQERPNVLAVGVRDDQVEFVANGTVVETLPVDEVAPWGVAGVRINHNLHVRVVEWSVERLGTEGG